MEHLVRIITFPINLVIGTITLPIRLVFPETLQPDEFGSKDQKRIIRKPFMLPRPQVPILGSSDHQFLLSLNNVTQLPLVYADEEFASCFQALTAQVRENFPEDRLTVQLWVDTVYLYRNIMTVLLTELESTNLDLDFWKRRSASANSVLFMIFGRGPITFIKATLRFLGLIDQHHIQEKQKNYSVEEMYHARMLVSKSAVERLEVALGILYQQSIHLKLTVPPSRPKIAPSITDLVESTQLFQQQDQLKNEDRQISDQQHNDSQIDNQQDDDDDDDDDGEQFGFYHQRSEGQMNMIRTHKKRNTNAEIQLLIAARQASLSCIDKVKTLLMDFPLVRQYANFPPDQFSPLDFEELEQARRDLEMLSHAWISKSGNRPANHHLKELPFQRNRSYPLHITPSWCHRPNRFARHWVRSFIGTVMLIRGAWFLQYHGRNGNLVMWASEAWDSLKFAVLDNIVKPLVNLYKELFDTDVSKVERAEVELGREILNKMLCDYAVKENGEKFCTETNNPDTNPNFTIEGMRLIMLGYEKQIENPIKSMLMGNLARSMLIQVQKAKVETELAMLDMDKVLRSNELTFALSAAIPAVLIFYLTTVYGRHLLHLIGLRLKPPKGSSTLTLRMDAVQVERSLYETLASDGTAENLVVRKLGQFLYNLNEMYCTAQNVFRGVAIHQSAKIIEWKNLESEIELLASATSNSQCKIAAMNRIFKAYECMAR